MKSESQRLADMVARDIAGRGIRDERVLAAMRTVPREDFVPEPLRDRACADNPLPIGAGQTISQPYIVALMAEALQLTGSERVLEVGTGSGYAAAVLAHLAARVDTVERIPELAERATRQLARMKLITVQVHNADGTLGWPPSAPYDAIMVSAAGPVVPAALRGQLAVGGRLVMPVGTQRAWQDLLRLTRTGPADFRTESLGEVAFVPLIGAQGWAGT